MSSTVEVAREDAAGEWGTNLASKVEKKPAPEKQVNEVLNSLFEEYYNKMGESFADHSGREFHVDEVAAVDNPLADWEAHLKVKKKQATSELDTYLTRDLHPPKKDFDILEWWEMHSINYPVLSCIARDVLAIQASTVASESSFSAGGRIISDHRTRLKSDTVEGLLCLQDWLNANDTKPTNKDAEEEVYLEFHQASKCHKEGRTRSRSFVPSSSPLSSPASSSSLSPLISPDQG